MTYYDVKQNEKGRDNKMKEHVFGYNKETEQVKKRSLACITSISRNRY